MYSIDTYTEVLSQYFPDGLAVDDIVQILYNNQARLIDSYYTTEKLPMVGIIREVKQVESQVQIDRSASRDPYIAEVSEKVFAVRVEINNITPYFSEFLAKTITKEEYINNMPQIALSQAVVKDRVPKLHEVVLLNYDNPSDPRQVKFVGFPFNEPLIDPRLEDYVDVQNGTTAKSAFQSGSGIVK